MTIKDLITKLRELPNQNRIVMVVVGNDEDDVLNTPEFDIHHQECLEHPVELFVHADEITGNE